MAFKTPLYFLLYVMILSFATFCLAADDEPSYCSKAVYYKSEDGEGTPNGACGLKEWGKKFNDGKVAAVSKLFKDGKGCGTCYEVKCKDKKWCSEKGVKIAVTDYGASGEDVDFIMSEKGYGEMAKDEESKRYLFKKGVVKIEYKRVKCDYEKEKSDFVVKYDKKDSKWPDYHSLVALYKGDKDYIEKVKIFVKDEKKEKLELKEMRRAYGAVWDIANYKPVPFVKIKKGKEEYFQWVEGMDEDKCESDDHSAKQAKDHLN
ncbi:OLC1v1031602C1 [Oldenlandia corymbosa var. corymbosa]|uniref:OLC1v1031602C1 n=1 Tax=Oldenlandia corymbosa var. corymbosa TaxID=529605 RepID=A0AAV1CKG4_OLDCO|nr:OLC1v1031602C1 [Oldenlandia corymbosa var. corymbosa]